MSLNTNFNVNPYYDDFDEQKKFLRLLFKPGYAVQARELTQAQTLLQNQIGRFGDHIFKNGSLVTGGQTFLQDATYLKLDTEYAGTAVDAAGFDGMTITNIAGTKRGEVIVAYDANAGTGDPKTLLIKQIYGSAFTDGETITTVESAPAFANISTSGVGTGQTFSVNQGVFYYDGFFIQNDAQTIATSKYDNNTANARIGFEITESVVVSSEDTSLLDPAQDASNFQAPGSDRYKIQLVLATRSGVTKKSPLSEYDSARTGGLIAINLREGDEVVDAAVITNKDEILLVSKNGMSLRFQADDESLRPMGRSSTGVIGMKFRKGDELLSMSAIKEDKKPKFVLTATDGGFAKRTPLDEYREQGRGGIGVKAAKIDEDSRGVLVGALIVQPNDEVLAITSAGTVIRTAVSEIRETGRDTLGVRLVNLENGVSVVSITRLVDEVE